MSTNDLIIANLSVLLKEANASRETKDRFRARAYRNAIKAIQNCNYEIQSGADAKKLDGIGDKIAEKIQEIIDTGSLEQVERMGGDQLEKTKILHQFAGIWGVGPVKAEELWRLGARSIADVKENFTDVLNDNQLIGLRYFEDLQKRIPRKNVAVVAKRVLEMVAQIKKELHWNVTARVCGSYRRRAKTCGDMDVLLCEKDGHPILQELVDRLEKNGVLIEKLGIGPTKYLGITKSDNVAFRIDMEVIKPEEWPFALLYFTGSGPFNEKQRLVAKKMGYSLSEHGLKDVELGTFVRGLKNERDIFDFLGMDYLEPWNR